MKNNREEKSILKIKAAARRGLSGLSGMAKKKKMFLIAAIVIGVAVLGMVVFRPKEPELNLYEAKKTDLSQEISLTGKVKAAESVSLSFERTGRISSFGAVSGKKIY